MKLAEQGASLGPWLRGSARRGTELEFLPAALEIVETPASPVGRGVAATIIAFFCAAIAWAYFSHVDITATAQGKIVPTGRTKLIQPLESGVIKAIDVTDGQVVKAGDILVEMDATINGAESDRLSRELVSAQLDAARLRALLDDADDPIGHFVAPAGASPAETEVQRSLLAHQVEEIRAKLANLDQQLVQSDASRVAAAAEVKKLTLSLPIIQQRAAAYKTLVDAGWGGKLQYLQMVQDLVEHQQEYQVQKAKLAEAMASLSALQEQRQQTDAEFRRSNFSDLSQAEQKVSSLQEQLVEAQQRRSLQTLRAPIDGTIQQLAVHTVGGVVTPAQQLMVLVPADSHLEIEASVSNRDIGFVHAGQPAEIKVETFSFTRYGLLHGEVLSVSADAIASDKLADGTDAAKLDNTGGQGHDGQNLEPVYAARVSLDREQMQVDGKLVNLAPGMAVTVEIKSGSRRVIDYLLSPLLRYREESLRER